MIIDWQQIDTVMLDMDGTILDLHYDNYFWQEWLPEIYAEQQSMSYDDALSYLQPIFQAKEGQLNWYCIDYWSAELNMNIEAMKRDKEVVKKIRFRDEAEYFLAELKARGINTWLVTNAHPKVVSIKTELLPIDRYFDRKISSHNLGFPKESAKFWLSLQEHAVFDPERVLFIDDSHSVLRSAQKFGIKHLFGVAQPDSKMPLVTQSEFNLLRCFKELL